MFAGFMQYFFRIVYDKRSSDFRSLLMVNHAIKQFIHNIQFRIQARFAQVFDALGGEAYDPIRLSGFDWSVASESAEVRLLPNLQQVTLRKAKVA